VGQALVAVPVEPGRIGSRGMRGLARVRERMLRWRLLVVVLESWGESCRCRCNEGTYLVARRRTCGTNISVVGCLEWKEDHSQLVIGKVCEKWEAQAVNEGDASSSSRLRRNVSYRLSPPAHKRGEAPTFVPAWC